MIKRSTSGRTIVLAQAGQRAGFHGALLPQPPHLCSQNVRFSSKTHSRLRLALVIHAAQLVRITNNRTAQVFYSRTHDRISRLLHLTALGSPYFDVPATQKGPNETR